jgi:hypothetical protein
LCKTYEEPLESWAAVAGDVDAKSVEFDVFSSFAGNLSHPMDKNSAWLSFSLLDENQDLKLTREEFHLIDWGQGWPADSVSQAAPEVKSAYHTLVETLQSAYPGPDQGWAALAGSSSEVGVGFPKFEKFVGDLPQPLNKTFAWLAFSEIDENQDFVVDKLEFDIWPRGSVDG